MTPKLEKLGELVFTSFSPCSRWAASHASLSANVNASRPKLHGAKGTNAPRHQGLKKRVKHMNTSKAEQIFSWFRGYASTFNSMDALRHRLIVLNYCKEHNALIDTGYSCHLNAHSANRKNRKRSRTTSGYACSKKAKK